VRKEFFLGDHINEPFRRNFHYKKLIKQVKSVKMASTETPQQTGQPHLQKQDLATLVSSF